jgi:hypothetical protein
MPINVKVRWEDCETLVVLEGVYLTAAHLPAYDDSRYPSLRLIDPYGDTTFGRYQMVAVIPELEALLRERPSPEIEAVLAAARKWCVDRQMYLTFMGDRSDARLVSLTHTG